MLRAGRVLALVEQSSCWRLVQLGGQLHKVACCRGKPLHPYRSTHGVVEEEDALRHALQRLHSPVIRRAAAERNSWRPR